MDDVAPAWAKSAAENHQRHFTAVARNRHGRGYSDYLSKWRVYRHGHRRCGFRRPSYQLLTPLTNGTTYNFAVSQTVNLIPSGQSPNYAITIDTTAPLAPLITSIIDDVSPGSGPLDKGQITNDSRPTLNGTGEAGATITLYDNGIAYATTTVNSNGFWSFTPTDALGEGNHLFTARATDAAGNQGDASADFLIIVDTLIPNAPPLSQSQTTLAPFKT